MRQLFRNLFHRQGFTYDYVFDWNMLKFRGTRGPGMPAGAGDAIGAAVGVGDDAAAAGVGGGGSGQRHLQHSSTTRGALPPSAGGGGGRLPRGHSTTQDSTPHAFQGGSSTVPSTPVPQYNSQGVLNSGGAVRRSSATKDDPLGTSGSGLPRSSVPRHLKK